MSHLSFLRGIVHTVLQSRSSAMGVVTHASSPVERSRPRLWPGHRRRNCAEDAECRHSAEPQRAPGFVQKVKCSHLYVSGRNHSGVPTWFCVDAHRHRMSSFAGKHESRLSLLEDVRLQRGAAASDPNYFRSGLLAGVNEKCSHKNACVCAPVSAHAPQSGGVFRVTRWSSLSINLCGHG